MGAQGGLGLQMGEFGPGIRGRARPPYARLLPAEGGLPRSDISKQASSSKQAKVHTRV